MLLSTYQLTLLLYNFLQRVVHQLLSAKSVPIEIERFLTLLTEKNNILRAKWFLSYETAILTTNIFADSVKAAKSCTLHEFENKLI